MEKGGAGLAQATSFGRAASLDRQASGGGVLQVSRLRCSLVLQPSAASILHRLPACPFSRQHLDTLGLGAVQPAALTVAAHGACGLCYPPLPPRHALPPCPAMQPLLSAGSGRLTPPPPPEVTTATFTQKLDQVKGRAGVGGWTFRGGGLGDQGPQHAAMCPTPVACPSTLSPGHASPRPLQPNTTPCTRTARTSAGAEQGVHLLLPA